MDSPIAVPIWEKYLLTLDEAAAYFGLGQAKLREMTDQDGCEFVLWNGKKRLVKRKTLELHLSELYAV